MPEVVVKTDQLGAGVVMLDVPASDVYDAVVTRGPGEVIVMEENSHAVLMVRFNAPNDGVNVGYGDEPGHVLLCAFCLTPQAPGTICPGAYEPDGHKMWTRPVHVHHEDGEITEKGHAQAAAHRKRYASPAEKRARARIDEHMERMADK